MPNNVIWITASAGAGKTTALVKRYEALLQTNKPQHIIGITFTINAAKEMHDRIGGQDVRIQTIHSLCHQILSTHSGKNIRILDPHEKTVLIQQATRMALNEPTDLTKALSEKFSAYHVQNVVEKILEKWRPNPQLDAPNTQDKIQNLCMQAIVPNDHILEQLKNHPLSERLRTNYIDVFLTKTGDVRKRVLDAETTKKFPNLIPVMTQEAQRVYDWQQEQAVQEWFYINALFQQLMDRVWRHYNTLKQDQKDYDELLIDTQMLLEDDVARYDICKNIHHVLLDEAQDTNPKQWRIIELLTQHLFDDPSTDKSFFVVGDHKQSIYGFQNARPEFFNAQKEKYQMWAGPGFTQQTLDTNYRSVEEICTYVQKEMPVLQEKNAVQVARSHSGFVLETTDFHETLAKFLKDPPFLPSKNRTLELQDIMILCRKRDKTYQDIIERYGPQVRYEQTQLLSDLPEIQRLMYTALLMAEPENAYAKYKVDNTDCLEHCVIKLTISVLQDTPPLLDIVLNLIAQHSITTSKSLYWWLRAYPYSVKTTSTKDQNTMQLLTMHGAKGLQAPVVFVFNDWTPYHQQDIWWDQETSDFIVPPTKNIHNAVLTNIREKNIAYQTAEETRLRYVAFTRAMDVLVVQKNPLKP